MRQLFGELGIQEEQQPAVHCVHIHHGIGDPDGNYCHLLRQHSARHSKIEGTNDGGG